MGFSVRRCKDNQTLFAFAGLLTTMCVISAVEDAPPDRLVPHGKAFSYDAFDFHMSVGFSGEVNPRKNSLANALALFLGLMGTFGIFWIRCKCWDFSHGGVIGVRGKEVTV